MADDIFQLGPSQPPAPAADAAAKLVTADAARELLDGTTPGPWTTARASGGVVDVRAPNEPCVDNRTVALTFLQIIQGCDARLLTQRNARLLAAAPDLARTVVAQADEARIAKAQYRSVVAEVDRLRAEVAAERTRYRRVRKALAHAFQTVAEQRAELAAARRLLERCADAPTDEEAPRG